MTATHQSQLSPGNSAETKSSGCTWTSLANGISATTEGRNHPTPDFVHAHVKESEETDPRTDGWSLPDADLAAKRLGFDLVNRTHSGFAAAVQAVKDGHYVLLQGDSDQFGNATCSGKFNGDHCIGWWPRHKVENGVTLWWIDDPICPTGRWEREGVLRRYAEKLDDNVRFAMFALKVPQPKPPVTLRYGGRPLAGRTVKTFTPPDANVRARPNTDARVLNVRHRGGKWPAWQVTSKGEKVAGSSRWFGSKDGRRWVHSSVVK